MAKGKYVEWITEDGLLKIQGWARDGLSEEQIAHNMGVAYSTFKNWKDKYPAFLAAIKRGKEVVDREIENALHKRAMGFSYDEVTHEMVWDEAEGKDVLKVTKVVTKTQAPDTGAIAFWLKNRKPDIWKERRENTHTGANGGPIQTETRMDLSKLTPQELRELAKTDE